METKTETYKSNWFILENCEGIIEIKKVEIDDEFIRDFEKESDGENITDELIREFIYSEYDNDFRVSLWVLDEDEFKQLKGEVLK